jgi:hypothetical protein
VLLGRGGLDSRPSDAQTTRHLDTGYTLCAAATERVSPERPPSGLCVALWTSPDLLFVNGLHSILPAGRAGDARSATAEAPPGDLVNALRCACRNGER